MSRFDSRQLSCTDECHVERRHFSWLARMLQMLQQQQLELRLQRVLRHLQVHLAVDMEVDSSVEEQEQSCHS